MTIVLEREAINALGGKLDATPSRTLVESIWSELAPELRRLSASLGVAPDKLDDVLQDVFVAAWKEERCFSTKDDLRRWLIRVAVNRSNQEHRKQNRWQTAWRAVIQLNLSLLLGGADSRHDRATESRKQIENALNDLPDVQRNVMVLRYYSNYSSQEIGVILEMPSATVRSHLRKGRKTLAHRLREFNDEA